MGVPRRPARLAARAELGDAAPVVRLDAGHRGGPHPRAEAADQVVQRAPVAAGSHDLRRAYRQRHDDAGAAEAAGGAVDLS